MSWIIYAVLVVALALSLDISFRLVRLVRQFFTKAQPLIPAGRKDEAKPVKVESRAHRSTRRR